MKKTSLCMAVAMTLSGSAFASSFANGGFETGDLSGWTEGGGSWGGNYAPVYAPYTGAALPLAASTFNGGTPNNTVVGVGTDPITGATTVYNGKHAVRVNDSTNDYSVSTIRQSVTNYTDNHIYFEWNAVLESSHGLTDSDYFSLTVHDDTTNTDLVTRAYSSAGSIGAGAGSVSWTNYGGWYSSGWVVEDVDVQALGALGHDMTVTLLASDCPYGGHAGYVYLDGFAPVIVTHDTPEPASLALAGLGLAALAAGRRRKTKS